MEIVKHGVGQPVRRKEDRRFVTGRGQYAADLSLPGQAYGYVLRSPHAHARIASLDTRAARSLPGVLVILTGADVEAAGLGGIPCCRAPDNRDGTACVIPPNPLLKSDRVRHVGDAIAFVVATTLEQARDAAYAIAIEYELLPVVVDTATALASGQPSVWSHAPNNLAVHFAAGDQPAVDKAFASAAHVATVDLVNNRVVVNAMEPRAAVGTYDAADGSYTLYTTSQSSHFIRDVLAQTSFRIPREKVRVVTRDVGGGFGMKVFFLEYPLVLWASRLVGRPVKWVSDRSEAFLADSQGRDHVTHAELALDADGRFLAIKVEIIAAMGAYLGTFGPVVPTKTMYTGVYDIPAAFMSVRNVYTNTVRTDSYRGAGRPEATYLVERLVDVAARQLGIDPVLLRHRNYIKPAAMPYTTAFGITFDSGEFSRNTEDAMTLAQRESFATRRAEARCRGRLRGLGTAYYIDATGGPVVESEDATVRIQADGSAIVLSACQASGQGHETAYAQLVAERLGIDFDGIQVHQGDTAEIPLGYGTGGSRSLMDGGGAVVAAVDEVIKVGSRIAAEKLEVAIRDIEFAGGMFRVVGTDRRMTLVQVAEAMRAAGSSLEGIGSFAPMAASYPNGCHVCEVEIDPETGRVEVVDYRIVDDFGRIVNPLLVAGQVHGGVVQGIGQALMEHARYDSESGQLSTGTFMDYAMPRATDVPMIDARWNEIPCGTNPLGVKGAGEGGTVGSLAAVVNAAVDALSDLGVTHLDMPLSAESVWRAIQRQTAP